MVDQSKSPLEVSNASAEKDTTTHKVSSAKDLLLKNIDWPFDTPELYKIAFNFFKGLQSQH